MAFLVCHSTSTNTSGLIKRHPQVISMHNRFCLLRLHQKKTCEDEDKSWLNASVGNPPLTECSPMNRMHTVKRDQLQLYTHRLLDNFIRTVLCYRIHHVWISEFFRFHPTCTRFFSGLFDLMLTMLTTQTIDSLEKLDSGTHLNLETLNFLNPSHLLSLHP